MKCQGFPKSLQDLYNKLIIVQKFDGTMKRPDEKKKNKQLPLSEFQSSAQLQKCEKTESLKYFSHECKMGFHTPGSFLGTLLLVPKGPTSSWRPHMGPEGPSNFTKKLKGSVSAIFFFVATQIIPQIFKIRPLGLFEIIAFYCFPMGLIFTQPCIFRRFCPDVSETVSLH